MLTLSKFKSKLFENANFLDAFMYQGKHVIIDSDFKINIDEKVLSSNYASLEEAQIYSKIYIDSNMVKHVDIQIPEEKIAGLIKKYHDIDKITHSLVESYIELASSNIFSIDPVITEIKEKVYSKFAGKLEYKLNDNTIIAIDEHTQSFLNTVLKDKYEIVEYMRESKKNFMHVIKELGE